MSKIIIGCDPDSNKSGMSFYINNELYRLDCMSLINIYIEFESISKQWPDKEIELHIENVKGVSGIFAQRTSGKNKGVALKMAQHVGMCKQVQTEIERIAEHFCIKVVRHQVSKMWKDSATGKAILKDLGWTGQSNEDGRSAAYFGYLGVKQSK